MKKPHIVWILALIALTVACSGKDDQQAANTEAKADRSNPPVEKVVVGLLAPKTGVMGVHGESMEMGAKVAETVLNKRGGINGKTVEVVVVDTQSDPAVTAQRARELIERKHVNLLMGTGLSSSTLAAIPIATNANVPFIYSMDGEAKTCQPGKPNEVSKLVWGAGFTERMIVRPFLSFLVEKILPKHAKSKVYFLGGDYVFPRATNQYARSVAEAMGLKVVGEEYADVSTTDYTPVIRRIMKSRADLLLVTNPGSAAVTFMRQAQQLGLSDKMIVSGFATFAQEAVSGMGNASQGVYYANRYSDLIDSPVNAAFVAEFRNLYPNQPLLPGPTVAAGGYGALMVAAEAFQKAGSTDPAAFYKAMRGLEMDLPQGHVIVDPDNNIFQQPMYLLRVDKQKYIVLSDLGLQKHPGLEGCSVR